MGGSYRLDESLLDACITLLDYWPRNGERLIDPPCCRQRSENILEVASVQGVEERNVWRGKAVNYIVISRDFVQGVVFEVVPDGPTRPVSDEDAAEFTPCAHLGPRVQMFVNRHHDARDMYA